MGKIGRIVSAAILSLGLLVGCSPNPPTPPTPTPTSSATSSALDFTTPGQAKAMVFSLVAAAESTYVLGVEVRANTVAVSVLKSGSAETWAYRDGQIQKVPSDIQYVQQARVPIEDFEITDVGALFRSAAAISGSTKEQELQIIDYSAGEIAMTVTTVPESRPVFFNRDGTPLASLDFTTKDGIAAGLQAAIGTATTVSGLGVNATQGAWIDYAGPDDTTLRRTRAAKIPPTVAGRKESPAPAFAVNLVSADTIWRVYQELLAKDPQARSWSVTVTNPKTGKNPVMKFTVGKISQTTDLQGRPVAG